jgi:hypothetical protein
MALSSSGQESTSCVPYLASIAATASRVSNDGSAIETSTLASSTTAALRRRSTRRTVSRAARAAPAAPLAALAAVLSEPAGRDSIGWRPCFLVACTGERRL